MKTEVVHINPILARQWLTMNDKNRAIRASHVETLRQSFLRGEYVQTHQGIAFGTDGHLIDGQHRLNAIALLPDDMSFPMLVTWGLPRETAFPVVDATQAKRTVSDVLGISRPLGECGTFLAIVYGGRGRSGVTPTFAAPFAAYLEPELSDLLAFCGTARKTWAAAPVRCAAVLSMKDGNTDYVKAVYRAMVLAEFDFMPPVARALFRAHLAGSISAAASNDIYARSVKLFDPRFANLSKVQISDVTQVMAELRERLSREVMEAEAKKEAPAKARGANGVYTMDSKAAARA